MIQWFKGLFKKKLNITNDASMDFFKEVKEFPDHPTIEQAFRIINQSDRYIIIANKTTNEDVKNIFINSHTDYKEIISDLNYFSELLKHRKLAHEKLEEILKENKIG